MTETEVLRKELEEIKSKLSDFQTLVEELTKPSNLYLRELAREVASGNRQALKEHNKRRWGNARR